MASRPAQTESRRRIAHALSNRECVGYVKIKLACADRFEQELERVECTMMRVYQLMHEHVQAGRFVKEQDGVPGDDYDIWYAITLTIGTKELFVKFVLEPDVGEEPGILIVSPHK